MAGVLGNRAVEVGAYVQPGTRLAALVPLDSARIVVVAGGMVCALGVLDDLIELDALTKFGGQVLAGGFLVLNHVTFYYVWLPGGGVLTLDGALAQRYRGPVATTSGNTTASGYAKNYEYDTRFSSVTPPYYLKPTSASFKVSSYAATTPAFSSTGAAN